MRVEKIELIGFKSFGERTSFQLHPGITCIVGPNGCGKSNVVDAFKWVLGEQSAKSLRGGKMEEVIFAGSQTRKPRGMTEVTLSVAGLGGNGDGNTLVTRRLYRSGDSDYLLNRTPCRLRDIRDIFLDTGLEIKSYSILEQDKISAILSARPEERRFIIEEVAGVVKYKVRRNEAQSKLESSRLNLARIQDIVAEVKRQINSLDRQVKKAERYKRLMEELRLVDLRLARRDYTALREELDRVLSLHREAREADSLLRADLSRLEADIETGRIDLVDAEKSLDAVQSELQSVEREMAEAERLMAVSKTDREHLRERLIALRHDEEESERKRASSLGRKEEITSTREGIEADLAALLSDMEGKSQALKVAREEILDKESLLESSRRESFRASEDLSGLRNEREKHLSSLEGISRRAGAVGRESSELASSVKGLEAEAVEMANAMDAIENDLRLARAEKERARGEIGRLKEISASHDETRARAREELASASSRLASLREMVLAETSAEGLNEHVRIIAAMADVIEVPREYERAVESALREAVNGFVVHGAEDVIRGVRAVKSLEMGRTAFLAGDIQSSRAGDALPEGALAMASDVVTAKEEFRGVVKNLLGGTVVVKDLESALSMRMPGLAFVTLEGDMLEPTGAVVAGKNKGVIPLKRQAREMEGEIAGMREKLDALEKEAAATLSSLDEMEKAHAAVSEKEVAAEKELSLLRLKAEKNAEEHERAGRKLSILTIELEEMQREEDSLRGLVAEKEAGIRGLESERDAIEQGLAGLQGEITAARAMLEERNSETMELRVSANSLRERLASLEAEERGLGDLLLELDRKDGFIRQETASTRERIRASEQESLAKEQALAALALRAGDLSGDISRRREELESKSEGLAETEQKLKAIRRSIDEAAHRLSELEVRKTEHALRMENLADNIRNTYAVELEGLEAEEPTPEDVARREEIKEKITALGPVSLGSLEEYEDLRKRHEFLSSQQEDLRKSIAELEEAISRINATTRKKLRDAYEALRAKFAEVFVALFGGGRAELVLTDENNILETGVDIVAQPPGKRFQNISLLSGGEKTLTALALLFAGFLIKPTPICILDEADAALDEQNTVKFAEMLRELCRDIQFVVITHNRVTMEAADYIYGITMEEPGNSRAVSLAMSRT